VWVWLSYVSALDGWNYLWEQFHTENPEIKVRLGALQAENDFWKCCG